MTGESNLTMTGESNLNVTTLAQPPLAVLLGGADSRRGTPDKKPGADLVEVRKGRLVMRTSKLLAEPCAFNCCL